MKNIIETNLAAFVAALSTKKYSVEVATMAWVAQQNIQNAGLAAACTKIILSKATWAVASNFSSALAMLINGSKTANANTAVLKLISLNLSEQSMLREEILKVLVRIENIYCEGEGDNSHRTIEFKF